MIQIQSIAFGTFAEIEPLNSAFRASHAEIKRLEGERQAPASGDRS